MGTAIFRQQLRIPTETERSTGDSEGEGIRGRRGPVRGIGRLVQVFRYAESRTAHEPIAPEDTGYASTAHYQEVSEKRCKLLTKRNRGRNVRRVMAEVKVFIRGWLGYFHVADMKRTMKSWDEWLRRRFRMYIWKQWKKPRTKVANLKKLGIPAEKAYQWGNSRLGYWRIAGSPVLECSITNERLAAAGYFSILNCYESLHSCD